MAHLRKIMKIDALLKFNKGETIYYTKKSEVRTLECMKMESSLVKEYSTPLTKEGKMNFTEVNKIKNMSESDYDFYKEEEL